MATTRKESEYEILQMVFAGMKEKYFTFDVNGDGTITNQEFRQVLEEMVGEPCPEEDWRDFINKVDYDNSGTISFEEFLYALYLWFAEDLTEADVEQDEVDMAFLLLKGRFKEFDTNTDQVISKSEFKNLISKIQCNFSNVVTDEVVNRICSGIEGVKNNTLNFKQYLYGMYLWVTGDKVK